MSSVRDLVDPENSLPHVELRPIRIQQWDGLTREKMVIVTGGEDVGICDVVLETDPQTHKAHFDGIEIDEAKRGMGIGLSAYLEAIELAHGRGLPFETQGYDQTGYSRKIWETLAAKGVAQVVEPFKSSTIRKDRFVGKFRIPKPED